MKLSIRNKLVAFFACALLVLAPIGILTTNSVQVKATDATEKAAEWVATYKTVLETEANWDGDLTNDEAYWKSIANMKTAYETLDLEGRNNADSTLLSDGSTTVKTNYDKIMAEYRAPIEMKERISKIAELVGLNDVAYSDKTEIDEVKADFDSETTAPAAFYAAFDKNYGETLEKAVEMYVLAKQNIENAIKYIESNLANKVVDLSLEDEVLYAYTLIYKTELVWDKTTENYVVPSNKVEKLTEEQILDTKYVNPDDYSLVVDEATKAINLVDDLDVCIEELQKIYTDIKHVKDEAKDLWSLVKINYVEGLNEDFSRLYKDGTVDTLTFLTTFDAAKYVKNIDNGVEVITYKERINNLQTAYNALNDTAKREGDASNADDDITQKGLVDADFVTVTYKDSMGQDAEGKVYSKDKVAAMTAALEVSEGEVKAVYDAIDAIGTVVYTPDCLKLIETAENLTTVNADDALNVCVLDEDVLLTFAKATDDEKNVFVTNYTTLLKARNDYNALKAEVDKTDEAILNAWAIHNGAEGQFDTAYTNKDGTGANDLYTELDANQQKYLGEKLKYEILRSYYETLEKEIRKFADDVEALVVKPTDECQNGLTALDAKYENFPADYKSCLMMQAPKQLLDQKKDQYKDETADINAWLVAVGEIAKSAPNNAHEVKFQDGTTTLINTPNINYSNWDLVTTAYNEYLALANKEYPQDKNFNWQQKVGGFFPATLAYYEAAREGRSKLEEEIEALAIKMGELRKEFPTAPSADVATDIEIGDTAFDTEVTAVTSLYEKLGTGVNDGENGHANAIAYLKKIHADEYDNYEQALKYQAAVQVEILINAIDDAEITLADVDTVTAAREAYNKYIATYQDIVRNLDDLTNAEDKLEVLTDKLNAWITDVYKHIDASATYETKYVYTTDADYTFNEGEINVKELIDALTTVVLFDGDDTTKDLAFLLEEYNKLILTDDETDAADAKDTHKEAFLKEEFEIYNAIVARGKAFATDVKTRIENLDTEVNDFDLIKNLKTDYDKLHAWKAEDATFAHESTQLGMVGADLATKVETAYNRVLSAQAFVDAIEKIVAEVDAGNYSLDNWALALSLKGSYYGFNYEFIAQAEGGATAIANLDKVLKAYEALSTDKILSLAGLSSKYAELAGKIEGLNGTYATDAELNKAKEDLTEIITKSVKGLADEVKPQIDALLKADEELKDADKALNDLITALTENTIPQAKQQAIDAAKEYVDAEIAKIQTKIDNLEKDNAQLKDALNAANEAIKAAQGTATAGLVIGIIALLAAAGLYVIKYALKK